jgi:hypothetical protein
LGRAWFHGFHRFTPEKMKKAPLATALATAPFWIYLIVGNLLRAATHFATADRGAGFFLAPRFLQPRSHRAATSGFRGAPGAGRRVPTERKLKHLDRTELD